MAGRGEECTPAELNKPAGLSNAARCTLVNEEGLRAVHALLHSRLLASGRCTDALLQPLRDLAAHLQWPALPPWPPDDLEEEPDESDADAEDGEEEDEATMEKKRRRKRAPGAYDDRSREPACIQGNLLQLLEKVGRTSADTTAR